VSEEREASRGIAEDAPGRGRSVVWKAAIVVGLAIAVAGVVAVKAGRGDAPAPPADDPVERALAAGRPVVADFGRGVCIPCKMMEPILADLQKDYAGRAEVLVIDIDRYPDVTRRLGVDAIPTQVFFDPRGEEVHRHQGFMPREEIVAWLSKMGVE